MLLVCNGGAQEANVYLHRSLSACPGLDVRRAGPRQLNRLGDEGGCALAEALMGNSRLQRLGLCANRLGSQVH